MFGKHHINVPVVAPERSKGSNSKDLKLPPGFEPPFPIVTRYAHDMRSDELLKPQSEELIGKINETIMANAGVTYPIKVSVDGYSWPLIMYVIRVYERFGSWHIKYMPQSNALVIE